MPSANHAASFALPLKKDPENNNRQLRKQPSAVFYQARQCLSHQHSKETPPVQSPTAKVPHSLLHQLLVAPRATIIQLAYAVAAMPSSTLLMLSLIMLLIILFFITIYLIMRLGHIQQKLEAADIREAPSSNLETIASWQHLLHAYSSKHIQQFLDINLEQIAKVWINKYIQNIAL